jgi:hypothetical protein
MTSRSEDEQPDADVRSAGVDLVGGVRGDGERRGGLREPVSSAGEDVPVWLSSDGCRLLLSSDREGRRRLYMVSRPPG